MPRGLWNWTDGALEWARVEFELGQWGDMRRAEYEASGIAPPFLDLPEEADYLDALCSPGLGIFRVERLAR